MEQNTFLNQVAHELLQHFGWQGLQDVALVFPMHRAGVMMREELRRQMVTDCQMACWAPEIYTLSDLFDSLCPLGKEEELFSVVRLYRLYRKHVPDAQMEIDHFYGWGRQLLADFTNISEGLRDEDRPAFFRNALSLNKLDAYQLDEEVHQRLLDLLYKGHAKTPSDIHSIQRHFEQLWAAMPQIFAELSEQLLAENKGFAGQRMRYVVSHWQEVRHRAGSKTYCFIGFNYLLPVERELMCLLRGEERALFFWDYVPDFRTNSKAFAFISQNLRLFPNALPAGKWGAPRKVKAMSVSSVNAEAQYADTWLTETYKHKGEATAVVICDETLLEPVIYALPSIQIGDEAAQVNITKGYPLRNTPTYAEVRKALAIALHSKLQPADSLRQAVARVDELSKISKAEQQNSWQWHLEREALYQTRRVLMQFVSIIEDRLVPEITDNPDLLERLVARCMEQVTLPFHGEPVTDLQLMGVLETRTMDFKHLLLLNVEEGVIPAHQPDKSFLPYYLRKAYGLQTHDERASVYAYNFFRLLRRAEDVTIVFSQQQSAMTKSTMSRFVMQMLIHPEEFIVERFSLQESNHLSAAKTLEVEPGRTWLAENEQAGKSLYLSPSAINTFYACKRRFYYEQVLGIREENEPEIIFSGNTTGTFVHEAMHYIYTKLIAENCSPDDYILPNRIEAFNTPEHRHEAIVEAYRRMNKKYMEHHEGANSIYIYDEHTMENSAIDHYLQRLLQRDAKDAARGLSIVLLEKKKVATVTCPLEQDKTKRDIQVTIGGRIDRMDRIGGLHGMPAQTRIVDYKSGKYKKDKMSDTMAKLCTNDGKDYVRQTLLYSFVAFSEDSKQSIEPHLYFAAQDLCNEKAHTRVELDGQPVTYDKAMHKDIESVVKTMVGDILRETDYPRCIEKDCSEYCPFLALCDRHPKAFKK